MNSFETELDGGVKALVWYEELDDGQPWVQSVMVGEADIDISYFADRFVDRLFSEAVIDIATRRADWAESMAESREAA